MPKKSNQNIFMHPCSLDGFHICRKGGRGPFRNNQQNSVHPPAIGEQPSSPELRHRKKRKIMVLSATFSRVLKRSLGSKAILASFGESLRPSSVSSAFLYGKHNHGFRAASTISNKGDYLICKCFYYYF